ncbi:MAG: hypothetical protein WC471_02635 [Candidatus Woesearchaeota archaeon]
MATKVVKVKKGERIIEYPFHKIKNLFITVGFTGGLLLKATNGVFKETKKLAKNGVVSVTDFEKAIVKAVSNTNKIAMNTTQKVVKRILK